MSEMCEYHNSQAPRCSERRNQVQDTAGQEVDKTGDGVDKQGLFVEFIQFLIKIGMFNEQVVMSMLSNKELFL